MEASQTHARFYTTSWTLIDSLRDSAHPQHPQALERLVDRYWPPVYASLRRMGKNREEAADITQAFFADVVIGRGLFQDARAGRGKLRNLLRTAVKRYAIDQHRRNAARSDHRALSLDELSREEGFLAREPEGDADHVFERRWAVAVMEEAMARCEGYFNTADRRAHWMAFEAHVVRPAVSAESPPPLAELAGQLGFPSAVHVASAMKVVRKRFRMLLREVAAETASDPEDQEAEYQRVVELLGGQT